VALTRAATRSPTLSPISCTERVVITAAISPMRVSTMISLSTLSEIISFTVPGISLRIDCCIKSSIFLGDFESPKPGPRRSKDERTRRGLLALGGLLSSFNNAAYHTTDRAFPAFNRMSLSTV